MAPLFNAVSNLSWPQRTLLWLLYANIILPLLLWPWRRRRAGASRAIAALPLVAANLAVPFLFDNEAEVLSSFLSAVSTSFLSNLKIVAWVLGRGSLTHPLTLPQFMATVALPITPSAVPPAESSSALKVKGDGSRSSTTAASAEGEAAAKAGQEAEGEQGEEEADTQAKTVRAKGRQHEKESVRTLLSRFAFKIVGLAAVVHVLLSYKLPAIPLVIVQTFCMTMILTIFSDGLAVPVNLLLGMPVAPHFETIYLSTSAADFWNRRWNQIVSNLLRAVVYDPIMEGRLVHRPGVFAPFSRTRRMLGVLASFTASGILHEGLFWYPTRHFTPHFLWFWHFLLWGVIMVAENVGRKMLSKRGITVPTPVAIVLFQILLHVMLGLFWLQPLNKYDIIGRSAANIQETWRMIGSAVLPAIGVTSPLHRSHTD